MDIEHAVQRSHRRRRLPSRGFTLVELLVVMAIIGILIALLIPAVQAAREAARQLQCKNNVKQLALGCLQHEHAIGFFPTGGWNKQWMGDPDRGFDRRQPGGWTYNVLPYIEAQALHDLGAGMNSTDKSAQAAIRAKTPLPVFYCPSRRPMARYPNHDNVIYNCNGGQLLSATARTDYAANAGGEYHDQGYTFASSASMAAIDAAQASWPDNSSKSEWFDWNGIMYVLSRIKTADVKDGLSNTYLLGERFMEPKYYLDAQLEDWDDTVYCGYCYSNTRWAQHWFGDDPGTAKSPGYTMPPTQDQMTHHQDGMCLYGASYVFGGPHPAGFNMAFGDGTVLAISFSIDLVVHNCLGNRADGKPVNPKSL